MQNESRERCPECGRLRPGYRRDLALEKKVLRMWGQGRSVRNIASDLQMSKSRIGRILQQARA